MPVQAIQSSVSYGGRIGSLINRTGTVRSTELLRDSMGSVVQTTNAGSATGQSFRYSCYGRTDLQSGYYGVPRNGWCGTLGYRMTNVPHSEQYVRARHYSSSEARWTTADPLFPGAPAYVYANARPTTMVDPTGKFSVLPYESADSQWSYTCCDSGIDSYVLFAGFPQQGGYIIQHIETTINTVNCDGTVPWIDYQNYFEAWFVDKGSDGRWYADSGPRCINVRYSDEWSWYGDSDRGVGKGRGTGDINYFPWANISIIEFTSTFHPDSVPWAKCLYATYKWPQWPSGATASTSQAMSKNWTCCCTGGLFPPWLCTVTASRSPNGSFTLFPNCPCPADCMS